MEMVVERVNVWAASIRDEVGGLGELLTGLQDAGADLDFILARRTAERPGTGVVFATPLRGDAEVAAAANLGLNLTSSVHSLRIEADDGPAIAAALTRKLAGARISMRGFSAAVIGSRVIVYIGLDSSEDADEAVEVLQQV